MSRLLSGLKYGVYDLLNRVDVFRGYSRNVPAVVGFCVHCEKIYDEAIYNRLVRFCRFFAQNTGRRLIVCVSTPLNPEINRIISGLGFDKGVYGDRINSIAEFCEIGYHGHFYIRDGERYAVINAQNPDHGAVRSQMREELSWLRGLGLEVRKYIAGWWYLSREIVLDLESEGIEADFSLRRSGTDSFGGRYLPMDQIPPLGRPFILPPSERIIEIQTSFGPTTHPYRTGKLLRPHLRHNAGEAMYLVFAIHDWDLLDYGKEIERNVEFISGNSGDFAWSDFDSGELARIRIGMEGYK